MGQSLAVTLLSYLHNISTWSWAPVLMPTHGLWIIICCKHHGEIICFVSKQARAICISSSSVSRLWDQSRRPTGINIFVKNTHQSEQLPPKEEVLLGNWVVKAKWLAVSFTSNISLKKIIWAFWRFYMYLRFKINIFKMQLLKNDTANLIDFNCFWSHFVSSFRKSCPLWCVILIKIHFQKIIGLVGHRVLKYKRLRLGAGADTKISLSRN